jgi:hypothetical protein
MNTWLKVIRHCCGDETEFMVDWIRGLILNPEEDRPYLYFWGPEECGKSTIHRAINLLLDEGQYSHVSSILKSPHQINTFRYLFNTTLCVVEEGHAHYVQDSHILLHLAGSKPINVLNRTNWIECSNSFDPPPFAKVFAVPPLEKIIPMALLLAAEKDAFLEFII